MRVIKVYEYSGGPLNNWKLVAYHYIILPVSYNDNFYKEVRSYNSFFNEPKRIEKRMKSNRNFRAQDFICTGINKNNKYRFIYEERE